MLNLVLAGLMVVFMAGCGLPLSKTMVIPEGVADSPKKLVAKLEAIKQGMPLEEVLRYLKIKNTTPGVRDVFTASEKREILYGGNVQGSPEELKRFGEHLDKHVIKEIKFVELWKSVESVTPISATTSESGPDLTAYLIFYEGKFTEVKKSENFYHKKKSTTYITDLFKDIFGSGASKGVSKGLK